MHAVAIRLGGAVAIALVGALLFAARAHGDVPPGFDLFETDPEATVFSFREEFTIPPNFFDQGSQPFEGDVVLGGRPLNTFQGRDVGDADTIFRRTEPIALAPPFPASGSTPYELVSLNLQAMQPIPVIVGGAPQLWDVSATRSEAQQSFGQIDVTQTSDAGGTYATQVIAFPRFTFTRLTDGAIRVFDTGEMYQAANGPQRIDMLQDLSAGSQNTPWRIMCVPPALPVLGVNDGFCPGLDPQTGEKALTPWVGRLARHGVYPAQPRLEHFNCYAIRARRGFRRRTVALEDQFGASNAKVGRPSALCAPARKDREPFENRRAHLQCAAIERTPGFGPPRAVAVRNQFGPTVLDVTRPTSLCTPTAKSRRPRRRPVALGRENMVDHFTCYEVTLADQGAPVRAVTARDQFGRRALGLITPRRLCSPTRKNAEPLLHPVQHLLCYRVAGRGRVRRRAVRTRNQFGSGVVRLRRYANFCVPTLKVPR
jgi:hypothetical protein